MDPLNAVSLAASILQFVEFTAKLVNDGRQIHDSAQGATLENYDLEAVTQSLVLLTRQISQNTYDDPSVGHHGPIVDPDAPTEQNLNDLGASCQDVAKELLDALEHLKAPVSRNRWTSIVDALKTVWARGKIQGLRNRLDQYRFGINTALLVSLRDRMSIITTDLEKLRCGDEMARLKADVLGAIQGARAEVTPGSDDSNAEIMRSLWRMTAKEKQLFIQDRLLEQLSFQDQPESEHRIAEAHAKTFRWIWTDPTGQPDKPWSHFVAWLEGDDDRLYWMTGKAGSGKSTLMKYVVHQQQCEESLRRWSGKMPLIVTRFYLWNSGSQDQMSQEGLIRAILHDSLSQHPEFIPKVLPKRWQRSQLFGSDLRDWDTVELEKAFESLAEAANGSFKLCLFVDGLDEFDGEHDLLIRLFRMAISFPNVKACLSSRPWPVFEEAFQQEPSLRLEDITFPDIVAYVTDHLTANSGYAALKRREPDFSSTLIQNIAKKSSGVFLWVTLVVKSLLAGLSNRDRVSDLQRRLDELPGDLEDFYQKIFDSIEPRYVSRASQLFRLIETSKGKLTSLGLSFIDEDDSTILRLTTEAAVLPLSDQESLDRYEDTRRLLNGRCKGFLEVPNIEYDDNAPEASESYRGSETESDRNKGGTYTSYLHPPPQPSRMNDLHPPPHPSRMNDLHPSPHPSRMNGRSNTNMETAAKVENPPPELRRVTYLHRTVRDFLQSQHIRRAISRNSVDFDPNVSLFCASLMMVKTWKLSCQRWSQLQTLGTDALLYAAAAEIPPDTKAVALDELDKSMQYHHRNNARHIFGASCDDNGNWAAACASGVDSTPCQTFLELAASYSLHDFISLKISGHVDIFADHADVPLLYRVISQYQKYPSFQEPYFSADWEPVPDVKLIQELLRRGMDPNFEVSDQTIWGCALQNCIELSRKQYEWDRKYVEQELRPRLQYWVQIVEAFIDFGADPRMNRNSQRGTCIREAFEALLYREARRLDKKMSRNKHRWSSAGKFLLPPQASRKQSLHLSHPLPLLNSMWKVSDPGSSWSERWIHVGGMVGEGNVVVSDSAPRPPGKCKNGGGSDTLKWLDFE